MMEKKLDIPKTITGFSNPVEHWNKKTHSMTELWWEKIKSMLHNNIKCTEKNCTICTRYIGEDWHDIAPHIAQCDFYGRFHICTDLTSLSWVKRMMITASYWDELGNKDLAEVEKSKTSIARACIDVVLGKDCDFDQRMSKIRCLLNLNTYTLRRALLESRYLSNNGVGAFSVGKIENLEYMIRGRLYEGMTLPYVEDDMLRRSCSDCSNIIVLAGQLGIVFHDAIDLPNDIFNGEYMNVYRMAASGGYDSLLKFYRGANTLLRLLSTTGTNCLCCGHVLQAAIANSVSWYFYCARYNYASNVQHVFKLDYPWENKVDMEAAAWVGKLLGANEKTVELIKKWEKLPLISHEEWGCGNKNPIKRFKHMHKATVDGVFVDGDTAEKESADAFCALSAQDHNVTGEKHHCLSCEIGYECIDMSVNGDMIGRFVYHALRLSNGKIEMAIDN